jgi:protein TonB
VPFIDSSLRRIARAALSALALVGCAQKPVPAPVAAPTPKPPPSPPAARVLLAAPVAARTWEEFQRQAALRMVAASPADSYVGTPPEPLLAIPVLEVELERDGRVREIRVLRQPTQARDTTQLAIDAVRRAAPYGDMSRLPKPWKFTEVFLFNDERRFMPRTLDD